MAQPPTIEPHVERPGPTEFRDPIVRRELQRAGVWFGLAILIAGVIFLAHPLLLIIGGMILAVVLDGGTRLLGRVLPIARGWRLLLVILFGFGFVGWVFYYAGTTFASQFEALRTVVEIQATRLYGWAQDMGLVTAPSALPTAVVSRPTDPINCWPMVPGVGSLTRPRPWAQP